MSLPLKTTYAPMEAQPATELPRGADWQYEPKWDGFRCLAFRDGSRVACSAPTFHTFRKPVDLAIAVADGSLRGIPAEPAALVAIDDDSMLVIVAGRLRQKLAEQYVCLWSNVRHAGAR